MQERLFWEAVDAADYFDLSKAVPIAMPNLCTSDGFNPIRVFGI